MTTYCKVNPDGVLLAQVADVTDGFIEVESAYGLVPIRDRDMKHLFKVVDGSVVPRTKEEMWPIADYKVQKKKEMREYTYSLLLKTDYIESKQADPDEPERLTEDELSRVRALRRAIRKNYRDFVIVLADCTTHLEVEEAVSICTLDTLTDDYANMVLSAVYAVNPNFTLGGSTALKELGLITRPLGDIDLVVPLSSLRVMYVSLCSAFSQDESAETLDRITQAETNNNEVCYFSLKIYGAKCMLVGLNIPVALSSSSKTLGTINIPLQDQEQIFYFKRKLARYGENNVPNKHMQDLLDISAVLGRDITVAPTP